MGIDALQPPRLKVIEAGLDLRAVAAAFAIAAISTMVFSMAPISKLVGTDPARALQANGARTFGGKSLGRFRFTLATAQIALSMSLLVLAALFAQSLANIARVDLGLRTESIVTFGVAPSLNGYTPERGAQVFEAIERELAAQPGVTGVSTAGCRCSRIVVGRARRRRGLRAGAGVRHARRLQRGQYRILRDARHPSAGRPRVHGSGHTRSRSAWRSSTRASRSVRARRQPDRQAGGVRSSARPPDIEIVGLVRDSAYRDVKAPFVAQVVLPRRQSRNFGNGATFYVRTAQSPEACWPPCRSSSRASMPVCLSWSHARSSRRFVVTCRKIGCS